jgi:hypothetical protein
LLTSTNAPQPRTRVDSGHVVDGDGIIRRIPKLAVRNRTSDESNNVEQAIATNSDAGSENDRSASVSSNSSQRARTPLSARSLSDDSVHDRQQSSRQRPRVESSKMANDAGKMAGKKKRGGLVNFLALKEPSTTAWAEFAEAEKQKAKQKSANGSSSAARHLATPSQKLPDFVPKVNSKWDGLPESAHRKSDDSKYSKRANRNSVTSTATRDTTWTSYSTVSGDSKTTRRAFATLSGKPIRDSMQSPMRDTFSARTSSSQGSGKQPPALALEFDPELVTEHVENTDENRPQTFLRDPSPPPQLQELPESTVPLSPPELEGDDVHYFQELSATPPLSPRTPPTDGRAASPALVGVHYPELDSIAKEAELLGDTRNEAVIRANSSRRPINFSRPQLKKRSPPALNLQNRPRLEETALPSPAPRYDGVLLSPTLQEPFLTDTFASHSQATGHIPQRVASTLVKSTDRQDEKGNGNEEEPPVSPISPVSPIENPLQTPAIPQVLMRPPTADSITANIREPDEATMHSQSQVSLVHSVAPSELSEHWRMSPKERLGLGSKLRKSEVLPWEEDDTAPAESSRGRLSPLPSPGLDGRKRLSWRSIGGKK